MIAQTQVREPSDQARPLRPCGPFASELEEVRAFFVLTAAMTGDILRLMELGEAWDQVQRILAEERVRPTVGYHDRVYELRQRDQGKPFSEELLDITRRWSELYMNPRLHLTKDREYRPQLVHEFPGEYVFKSENFDLLTIIFGQLAPEDRVDLIHILTQWLSSRDCCRKSDKDHIYPSYRNMVSEFPLIAEFIVRRGYAKDLFKALSEINNPSIPLVILFLALEDMIALNFTLFSDDELREIPRQLQLTLKFCWTIAKAKDSAQPTLLGKEDKERAQLALQICVSIKGLIEECRTARHYYLKEHLLHENPNLEIEGDKKADRFSHQLRLRRTVDPSLAKGRRPLQAIVRWLRLQELHRIHSQLY